MCSIFGSYISSENDKEILLISLLLENIAIVIVLENRINLKFLKTELLRDNLLIN